MLPASSICLAITHPPASLQVWKGLKHDIEIYTVVNFLSFAHFQFLFEWLLSFYGLCTEALPCSKLFLWPHTSKTTVALGCNLKGGRIPSTAWEARMWFVTEVCQVTFPLIPISSKLSSAQHLTQKCPFAWLTHPLQERVLAEHPLYPLPEAAGTWGRMGGLLSGMEVTIFKDYGRVFKYMGEMHGRTEKEVQWPHSVTLPLPCRPCKCPVAASNQKWSLFWLQHSLSRSQWYGTSYSVLIALKWIQQT